MAREHAYHHHHRSHDDDYSSDRSYRQPHASSTRRRRRHRDSSSRQEARYGDEPDLDHVRKTRVAYYSRSAEEQRFRDEEDRRMAYERNASVRKRESPRRVKDVESSSRQRRTEERESRRRRAKREEEEDDRSSGYVYRSRDRGTDEPRRRTRTVRHVEGEKDLRRSRTSKTPRKDVVQVIRDESPERPEPTQRISRSTSVRESSRPYMQTRPAVRRNTTTTPRARETSAVPPVRRVPSLSRLSPEKTRRNSTGFLSLFRPPISTPVQQERRVNCVVCMADDLPASKAAKLSCGHSRCHSCLKRQFGLSVTDPQHMPPRCCTSEHIPLKHVERLFPDKFKMLWNKKYQEYTTKNRIYCPTRGCGEWIKPSNIRRDPMTNRKYATCRKCREKACVLCNGKWHSRRDCPKDDEMKRFAEMAKEKGWQQCYNCKATVELKEGCYHMTCRCTAQFCMLCAAKWKTCTCPWFDHPDLDPDDRLLNMQIPNTYQVPVDTYRRTPSPVPAPPLRRSNTSTAYTSLPRNTSTYINSAAATSGHPDYTRAYTHHYANSPAPSRRSRNTDGVALQAFGNAGSHHLNESYALRPASHHRQSAPPAPVPAPAPPPPRAESQAQQGARTAWLRTSGWTRERSKREKSPPSDAPASVMAGMGSRGKTGANRVGMWRQHVRHDPAAVWVADRFDDEYWTESDSGGYDS